MSDVTFEPHVKPPFWARAGFGYAVIAVVTLLLFAWRISGSLDLLAYAQDVPAMYVLDAVVNHHWLCQSDARGLITSKPPVYTWLAGLVSLVAGRVTWFTLCLPSGLATLGTAWVVLALGRSRWSWQAGFWAALVYLMSPMTGKQVVLVRTDPVFTLTVALTAVAALVAWERGRGWTWFWLAAAAATLTKGPAGVVFGAAGLAAVLWERRSGQPATLRGNHIWGLVLYGVVTLGWFGLAVASDGRAVVDKMLVRELMGHTTGAGTDETAFVSFYKPTLYFLGRFAPWSLLTCVGLWRVVRRPAIDATERRFERFLWCWLVLGLVLFSLAAHVRPDLVMPLMPPAALLAGREICRLMAGRRRKTVIGWAVALVAVGMVTTVAARWLSRRGVPTVEQTQGVENLADELRAKVGAEFPFTYVDRTFALQFFLGTMRQAVEPEEAMRLLGAPTPAFIVVRRHDKLLNRLGPILPGLRTVARWPAQGEPFITIISNHPRLEWTDRMAFGTGPFTVQMEKLRLKVGHNDGLWLTAGDNAGTVRITNDNRAPHSLSLRVTGPTFDYHVERILAAGETWTVSAPFRN